MKHFNELADGAVFFVCGGFELIKVNESDKYNAVLKDDSSIGVTLPNDEKTFGTMDEVKDFYPESAADVLVN